MALKLDLCKITAVREIPWKDDVTQVREGQALKRAFENGEEHAEPSDTANENGGFLGTAYSTETAIKRWPAIEVLTLEGNTEESVALAHRPADRTNRLAIYDSDGNAEVVSTDGSPGASEIDVSATGAIETGSSIAGGTYTFVYEYEPSAREARVLQGDTEPGNHVTAEFGSTSVITAGDVFTTEWDVEADWDAANAAHGVRMTTDGRFTTSDSAANAIPGVAVIQYPTAESEFLGLRYAL